MSGAWAIERLDLAAYLERIGYDGDTAPTARTLAALHRAHLAAIPFENLDIVLGRGIDVGLDGIQAKLVQRRRGGYCFEHGSLFAAVLERLGYEVDRLLARVGDAVPPRARTHMAVRVRADGDAWLADVGFGNAPPEPMPFGGGPQRQGAWTFELRSADERSWELRERQGEKWVKLHGFDDQRVYPADVVMANHFTSTFPRSPFVGRAVLIRRDEEVVRRLAGRILTESRPDGSAHERELSDAELREAIQVSFGVALDDDESRRVVAAASSA